MKQKEKLLALGRWYTEAGENNNGWKVVLGDGSIKDGMLGPHIDSDLSKYIINEPKPENKIIDMSVCIKSGIDVEFSQNINWWYIWHIEPCLI